MKRLFFLSLLVVLAMVGPVFAADNSHAAAVGGKIDMSVAIADASSGYTAEVSSTSGALNVAGRAQAVTSQFGDGHMYTGAARIQTICVEGPTAGDYAEIYDAITATGTAKFDPRIAANTSSQCYDVGGAPFATGIYINATDGDVLTTVVYDY